MIGTPSSYTCIQRIESVQILIENGADPNLLNDVGRSPLSEAIIAKSLEIVTFLVEKEASMISLDGDGYSPFHKAVKSDNASILQYFAQNGVEDSKAKDINGYAFEVALNTKKINGAKILLYNMFFFLDGSNGFVYYTRKKVQFCRYVLIRFIKSVIRFIKVV